MCTAAPLRLRVRTCNAEPLEATGLHVALWLGAGCASLERKPRCRGGAESHCRSPGAAHGSILLASIRASARNIDWGRSLSRQLKAGGCRREVRLPLSTFVTELLGMGAKVWPTLRLESLAVGEAVTIIEEARAPPSRSDTIRGGPPSILHQVPGIRSMASWQVKALNTHQVPGIRSMVS